MGKEDLRVVWKSSIYLAENWSGNYQRAEGQGGGICEGRGKRRILNTRSREKVIKEGKCSWSFQMAQVVGVTAKFPSAACMLCNIIDSGLLLKPQQNDRWERLVFCLLPPISEVKMILFTDSEPFVISVKTQGSSWEQAVSCALSACHRTTDC